MKLPNKNKSNRLVRVADFSQDLLRKLFDLFGPAAFKYAQAPLNSGNNPSIDRTVKQLYNFVALCLDVYPKKKPDAYKKTLLAFQESLFAWYVPRSPARKFILLQFAYWRVACSFIGPSPSHPMIQLLGFKRSVSRICAFCANSRITSRSLLSTGTWVVIRTTSATTSCRGSSRASAL